MSKSGSYLIRTPEYQLFEVVLSLYQGLYEVEYLWKRVEGKSRKCKGSVTFRIDYTSRGHGCEFYSELVFVDSKGAEKGA